MFALEQATRRISLRICLDSPLDTQQSKLCRREPFSAVRGQTATLLEVRYQIMKKTILLIMAINLSMLVRAEVFPTFGVDSVGSDFFREWYVTNDLVHYLDNGSDNVFYEAETTGEWNMPDQKLFSIAGNPYKWNKYYLNGFRIDNRFQVGSMLYHADIL